MLSKKSIEAQLKVIENLYDESLKNTSEILLPSLYSKLYLLEVAGWAEEAFESILVDYLSKYNLPGRDSDAIKNNHGCSYLKVEEMGVKILGIREFQRVEQKLTVKLNNGITFPNFEVWKGELTLLKKARDLVAHIAVVPTIDAPSITHKRFTAIYPGVKIFSDEVNKL